MSKLNCSKCGASDYERTTVDSIQCKKCQTEFALPLMEFELPDFQIEDWTETGIPEIETPTLEEFEIEELPEGWENHLV